MIKASFEESNYLMFRLVMGFNMTIHGAGRIFGDYSDFIGRMEKMFADTFLPEFLISFSANLISPLELIFGLLLIVGFKTKLSIIVLNMNMMMLNS